MQYIIGNLAILLLVSFVCGIVLVILLNSKLYKSGFALGGIWLSLFLISLGIVIPQIIAEGVQKDKIVYTPPAQKSDIIQVRVLTDTFQDYYIFRDKLEDFIEAAKTQFPTASCIYVVEPSQHRFKREGVSFVKWTGGGFRYWQAGNPPGR